MFVTSGILDICIIIIIIIIIMDVHPTNLIQRTCAGTLLSKIEEELLARLLQLTRLLGYYWLSGKLVSSLHIHASHTWLLAVIQHNQLLRVLANT